MGRSEARGACCGGARRVASKKSFPVEVLPVAGGDAGVSRRNGSITKVSFFKEVSISKTNLRGIVRNLLVFQSSFGWSGYGPSVSRWPSLCNL